MHSEFYFFDLPVYRISRANYYKQRNDYVDSVVFQVGKPIEQFLRLKDKDNPRTHERLRDHLERSYGGCWEFNEIIGYIRLHLLGSQVRGEYFGVVKKRIIKTRKKTFEWITYKLAPEVEIQQPYGSAEVLAAIRKYITRCKQEMKGRYIDTDNFDAIALYVDWKTFLKSENSDIQIDDF